MSYFLMIENRHLAEWRFSLFTLMVITNPRICKVKVIGIASPPFGWCGRPPTVYGVTLVDPILSNICCLCQVKYADPYERLRVFFVGSALAVALVAPDRFPSSVRSSENRGAALRRIKTCHRHVFIPHAPTKDCAFSS